MKNAEFIFDSSEKNVDLYYATGFRAPDPFVYFKVDNKKYLLMSDLEIDRARNDSKADEVISISEYQTKLKTESNDPKIVDVISHIFHEYNITELTVPRNTSFTIVDALRKNGFKINAGENPFYKERLVKNQNEIEHILKTQETVFSAIKLVEDMLKKSEIKNNNILHLNNEILTSERVRTEIEMHLLKSNCKSDDQAIVACGMDSIDPHNYGKGPLKAHTSIIVDIFPKSMDSYYCGDATRTFCKGEANPKLKQMYNTVKEAQLAAIKQIKAGVNGREIHESIQKHFTENGYTTGEQNGRMQGFFHGTGHGIGLEVHEEPVRINTKDFLLQEGHVVSVEPGLYYKDIGGVRIEDLVLVTKDGCKVLGSYPKELLISC